ncbi:MAG: hypothetical protein JSV96_18590 [Candidatus Aminicenantes bacterium]|nr:MAG: hypothetical protein JSV96_18590 [Candidatus Aminicenantes bacterium]
MKSLSVFCFFCLFLLLVVSASTVASDKNAADDDVFVNPESLVRGLYAAVTFDPGTTPDWDYVRKFFIPEAVFAMRKTRTSMAVMNVEEFVGWFEADVEKYNMKERGFEEIIQKMKTTVFGHTAHCFVVYKVRFKTPADLPGQLGMDSFGLMKKDGRWWIVSVTNDIVTPQNPLPEELR